MSIGGAFAAFAIESGSFYTDNGFLNINGTGPAVGVNDGCTPARSPLPMLEIHGDADTSVHY
ncbi:hypothetical protein K438DRAFT_1980892 [Mycena galopus ATCC 62051]|nr:hypothetical protein K438DRAFT_1980892 [Mycena galopus ATCC 62051]